MCIDNLLVITLDVLIDSRVIFTGQSG